MDDARSATGRLYSYQAANPLGFELKADGKPKTTIDNFLRVLRTDDRFAGLKFNQLTNRPENIVCGVPKRWGDEDDAETRRYIEKEYGLYNVSRCDDALRIVFRERQYHPIRDLMETLKWDGKPRIYDFLHKVCGCEDTPYTREVSRLIFAGGIHRLYNPGCKFDDMPVLVGTKQGEGKSTLVRWIAMRDEFFTEVTQFDGQAGIEALEGAWICEVGELLAMTKVKEQEAVKAYLTRLTDKYRVPYDKHVAEYPRQCIFIGTTNKAQFLTDLTGNRRFYPVQVNTSGYDLFDHEAEIREYISQCWAEAKQRREEGKIAPFADRAIVQQIREAQSEAMEDDYRIGMIQDYLENKTETCVIDLWKNALHNEFSRPTKKDSNEIGLILRGLSGWERCSKPKRFADLGLQKYWKKQETENNLEDSDLPPF